MSKFVAVFKRLKIYILNSGIVVARKLWEKKKDNLYREIL
jgi:hypothetical protein